MSVKAAGGNIMGHAVTYRVRLWTLNQGIYHATIVSSPYHPQNTKSFYIGEEGLVDDNPSADELPTISFLGFDLEGEVDLSLSTIMAVMGCHHRYMICLLF
jgi:hypothetical protein